MRENGDFRRAATQYERTAYEYPAHEKAAAAGYAAIFAHRENLKVVAAPGRRRPRRATVASSLRFSDTFPQHEQAPIVLVAAAQDLYDLKDYAAARDAGRKLLEKFPSATRELQRTAWTVVAHSSFELAEFPVAEQAYVQVLAATPADDESRPTWSRTSRLRSTSRARRPMPPATTAPPQTTSCASRKRRRLRRSVRAPSTTRAPR